MEVETFFQTEINLANFAQIIICVNQEKYSGFTHQNRAEFIRLS